MSAIDITDEEEYVNTYWPQLKSALDTVLLNAPGTYPPISYEQVHFKRSILKDRIR